MAKPGWLNENQGRCYPLVETDLGDLPRSALVDCGFLPGFQAFFAAAEHSVWLETVARSGDVFTFTFHSDAPGLVEHLLVFTRDLADGTGEFVNEFVDVTLEEPVSLSLSLSEDCPVEVVWSGFLVTGDLTELADAVGDGESITGPFYVEPATIQNVSGCGARTLNLANGDRTRVTNPEECLQPGWTAPPTDVYVQQRCLQGHVRFQEGYNSRIEQSDVENSITINAAVGDGAGEPCDEVPLYDDEEPPAGSSLLTGGEACHELIRTVNGAGGINFRLLGGQGVRVTPFPEESRLLVSANLHDMAVCEATDEEVSESAIDECSEPLDPDATCGEA